MAKQNIALIGSGNIGTDLMVKALRSAHVAPVWMVGIDPESDGLSRARAAGLKTTHQGLDGLMPHLERDDIRIAFDATSAHIHREHARRLREAGVAVVDLTPAAVGPYCVPPVNLVEHAGRGEMNVNMVSCGGQATIPIVAAISRVQAVGYAEIIATVASRSAGPGTLYSSFLLFAQRAAQKYGVSARDVLVEMGRRKAVGGQEDLIEEVALELRGREPAPAPGEVGSRTLSAVS